MKTFSEELSSKKWVLGAKKNSTHTQNSSFAFVDLAKVSGIQKFKNKTQKQQKETFKCQRLQRSIPLVSPQFCVKNGETILKKKHGMLWSQPDVDMEITKIRRVMPFWGSVLSFGLPISFCESRLLQLGTFGAPIFTYLGVPFLDKNPTSLLNSETYSNPHSPSTCCWQPLPFDNPPPLSKSPPFNHVKKGKIILSFFFE